MFVITKGEFDWKTGAVLTRDGYEYAGDVALCCGASSQQTQLADAQQAYYTTLTNEAQQEFGQASGIFNELKSQFSPILAAGPNQEGYDPETMALLNSKAATGTGQE